MSSECGVGGYGLGMSVKVSVVSMCMGWRGVRRCLWCRCVWAGDECGGVLWCRCVWAGDECGGV